MSNSYEDIGFDQFLNKSLPSFADPMSSEDTGSLLMSRISGSSLVAGKSLSNDGKLIIDWDTGEVTFSDGARSRVMLGRIEGSENYGIKIVDAEGNIVLSTTGQIQTAGIADNAITTSKILTKTIVVGDIADALSATFFTDSTTKDNIEAWKHSSDVTKIDGGDVYAGSSITIGSSGHIKSGQTAYNTGTGWWIGNDGGTPKLSIGNAGTNAVTWDGTTLTVRGVLTADDISSGGTITGNILTTGSTGSNINIELDKIELRDGETVDGLLYGHGAWGGGNAAYIHVPYYKIGNPGWENTDGLIYMNGSTTGEIIVQSHNSANTLNQWFFKRSSSGSVTDQGFFCGASNDYAAAVGFTRNAASDLVLEAPAADKVLSSRDFLPETNNGFGLGMDAKEWIEVWAYDTSINHADLAEAETIHPDYLLSEASLRKISTEIINEKVKKRIKDAQKTPGLTKEKKDNAKITIESMKSHDVEYEIEKIRHSKIPSGSVVAITSQGYIPTQTTAQTNLLGVISEKPGIKMGHERKGGWVAKVGRVPCFVVGTCNAGDLLQSSDTEGCAKVAVNPKVGSLIGRAKEDKTNPTKGLIEIEVCMM